MRLKRLGGVPIGQRIRLPRTGRTGVVVAWETKDRLLVKLDDVRAPHDVGRFRVFTSGLLRLRWNVRLEELRAERAA
jgi:hypothetical protein